jgi:hypothetical protein
MGFDIVMFACMRINSQSARIYSSFLSLSEKLRLSQINIKLHTQTGKCEIPTRLLAMPDISMPNTRRQTIQPANPTRPE